MAMFKKGSMTDMMGGDKKPPAIEVDVDLAAQTSKSAAKDIIDAIKSGDAGALDSALKAHYEACEDTGGDGAAEKKPGGMGADDKEPSVSGDTGD